jgi:hypothetical protein
MSRPVSIHRSLLQKRERPSILCQTFVIAFRRRQDPRVGKPQWQVKATWKVAPRGLQLLVRPGQSDANIVLTNDSFETKKAMILCKSLIGITYYNNICFQNIRIPS